MGATAWWVLGRLVRVLVGAVCVALWIGTPAGAGPVGGISGVVDGEIGCSAGCVPLGGELAQAAASVLVAVPVASAEQGAAPGTFYQGVDYLRIGATGADGMMAYSAPSIAAMRGAGLAGLREETDWRLPYLLLVGTLLAGGGVALGMLWPQGGR